MPPLGGGKQRDFMISTATETVDRARRLVGEHEYNEAERVCRGILAREPDHLGAINTLSHALYSQGRPDAAIPLMERAVQLAPELAKYHSNLGFLRGVCGDDDGAVLEHERAVELEPSLPAMRVNLANAYRLQKRYALARDMFRSALALDPTLVVAWQNLADVEVGCDEHDAAIASLKQVLALDPGNLLARQQLVIVYRALDRNEELAALYRAWIAEDPDGTPVARHMLAACTGQEVPARASDQCIERLFDQDAADFEAHLVAGLGYRAPELCAEAFARHAPPPSKAWNIVDAGCGTGLCGPLFARWARELEGVDLSNGMLERAQAKQVYSHLHRAELTTFMASSSERWNAVVCADTLCYFGDLASPLRAAYAALRDTGLIVFTVEAQSDDLSAAYGLQSHGRYVHSRAYLERTLVEAGFDVRELNEATLRFERGAAVRGFVVVAGKATGAATRALPVAVALDAERELELAHERLRKHELLAAERVCDSILQRHPEHADSFNAKSMIELARGDLAAAIGYLERAIALAPTTAGFHCNLGHMHASRSDYAAALPAYLRATELEPSNIAYLSSLALAYKNQGEASAARESYQRVLTLQPGHTDILPDYADACVACNDFDTAVESLKKAIELDPHNLAIRGYLAHLYRRLGRRDELAEHYRSWIAEDPNGAAVARHNLAAITGLDIPARASDRYVQQLFDSCADEFDERLIDQLGYRAPAVCKEAFERHMPEPVGALSIIDLGCGTGLCGPLFAPWARVLEGVDLSERMLSHARARNVYSKLQRAELTAFIASYETHWDAAVCGDTFCYFGDLEAALRATYQALKPGGMFVFTVEVAANDTSFVLQECGRYTHSRQYVAGALVTAGYTVIECSEQTLRFENKQPVQGLIVVARKPAAD